MNITHAVSETITGDRLQAIFLRQKELWKKYHDIEFKNGTALCPGNYPLDLDNKKAQVVIKDYCWRVVEELGEALDGRDDDKHLQEELVDGLHFLTELTILVGRDYNTITDFEPDMAEGDYLEMMYRDGKTKFEVIEDNCLDCYLETAVSHFITQIGMMCNCLKNKPWKQTHMSTDVNQFFKRMELVWIDYFSILVISGMSSYDIADNYLRKSQVNQFRQRSNY